MNRPNKTPEELLAEFDAELLSNPKRTTDDSLLELSLGTAKLDEEAKKLAMVVKMHLLTKGDPWTVDPFFDDIEQTIARLRRIKETKDTPGRPRVQRTY
jgi:hypothetical protein